MQTSLDEKLRRVAVVGACGKMGRGIALLLLLEMAFLEKRSSVHLYLIDPFEEGFHDLKVYLEQQLTRFAEKNINALREVFKGREDLVDNGEMVGAFVKEAMRIVNCSTEISSVKNASVVFEAAFEDIALKEEILRKIQEYAPEAWVLTNTSSIPISLLAKGNSKIIGCHFYNPPPVQKLIEIIPHDSGEKDLTAFTVELAKRLKKTVVFSKDVAGFIGNGHFAREIVFACELVEELSQKYPKETAIQIVDAVTRDQLKRPMGIFQLLDYVGIPVAEQIMNIMNLKAPLIQEFIQVGLKGGQTVEGHSKDGIYQYNRGKIQGIFSLEKKAYVSLGELSIDQGLANRFLQKSFEIESMLVDTGVAVSMKDVSTVLKTGFHHSYSPDEVIK